MSANYFFKKHHYKNNNSNINSNRNPQMNRLQNNTTNNIIYADGANEKIMLISQPPVQPVFPNGSQYQTLLGAPLIPIIANEKHISATEKNLQIIEEVIKEKKEMNSKDINEIYLKSKIKCDLHPKQLSEKCRKCKEIRKEILDKETKEKQQKEKNLEQQENKLVGGENIAENNLNLNQEGVIYSNYHSQINLENENFNLPTDQLQFYDPPFKIYGDPITCNLNPLILNNILSCQYFKDEVALKGFNEILAEIIQNVNYAEPWAIGMSGIPSTLFCCLYKLMLLKLTESQVKFLLDNTESSYIRCTGFLYVRYLADPKELWNILSPYLSDQEILSLTADHKNKIKIGKYVENLLRELDYYGTRLPRLPTQVERDIKIKLIELEENKIKDKEKDKDFHNRRENISRSRDIKYKKKASRKFSSSNSSSGRSRSYSRHKKRNKKSHSRSRSKSISNHKSKDKDIVMKKIKEKERESALAKGKEYAIKPTSYKSSLSTKLPGNIKKRSRSPSPLNQNIEIIKLNKEFNKDEEIKSTKKIEYSKEFLERQEMLRKQYGEDKNAEKSKIFSTKKKNDEDDLGPDIMRLG